VLIAHSCIVCCIVQAPKSSGFSTLLVRFRVTKLKTFKLAQLPYVIIINTLESRVYEMGAKTDENDEIHLLRDAVIAVVEMADDASNDNVKLAMDILLAGTAQLGTIFLRRCVQLANQKQPRAAKPPKPAPAKGPQQQKPKPSNSRYPSLVRMTLRTVLRLFRQFSREFVKLSPRLQISNEHCVGMSMELKMMRSHFAKLQKQFHRERQAHPKSEAAARQSV